MADTTTAHRPGGMSPGIGTSAETDSGVTGQAQEKASELAGQAKDQAQQAAGQAKSQIRTQVDQRSTQAGQQVSQTAGDIRTVSGSLREQGKDGPAKIADQAAERIERVGSYLTHSDADRIMGDVEDFARRQPWTVIAGGIAAGFLASRFLKASQGDRYQQRYTSRPQQLPNTMDRPLGTTAPPAVAPSPVGTLTDTDRERFRTGGTESF